MEEAEQLDPNWRDAAAYTPLLGADPSLLAWEWLRRNPAYQRAAERALCKCGNREANNPEHGPGDWGLHLFERPSRTVPMARPLWEANVHPYVLKVHAAPSCAGEDCFDIKRFESLVTLDIGEDEHEHLLLSDGLRTIRLDVVDGTLMAGPVQLHYHLAGIASAAPPLLSLRRLLVLCARGTFSASLHPDGARAGRLVLILRAYDALVSGATQRQIAAELLGAEAGGKRWRISASTLRTRAQRLVRGAEAMAGRHYLSLLRR